ncbi:hypothetical protein FAGAP_4159 [Fusarium agapanthi]|uniref:Heterokaryon incompatibility domain-containing protein n=1 Tax=Fusarium agapanthi TaxID=1803897 RepID=A0A9P5EE93_9HYPO|nr:hypothetical protein FAGAP_4159 [Fusarium agapanthi]
MEGERLLEKLWRAPTEESLQCQKSFKGSPLIRTFRIEQAGSRRQSSSAVVSTSRGDIILFDRHMDCVVSSKILFSTVSHVWDPNISKAQRQQKNVPETPETARRVLDISTRIYNGIERPGYEARELWLDYISVPQWSDALRSNILPIMDKLFSTAETTVLYLDAVSPKVVNELYKDKRTPERLSSVISVCNSKYFKRVWTAMEFIRSERVRMMISNYTYLPDLDDHAFLGQVFKAWKEEMGKIQVPWSLGTLRQAKLKRMNFAMATALLCKRGYRDRMDFLHALRGIVRARSFKPNSSDFETEYHRIAWKCLKVGDYSPLLITPFMGAIERRGPGLWSEFGYSDVFTWQLGQEVNPPTLGEYTILDDSEQRVALHLEHIGTISIVGRPEQGSMIQAFSSAAKLALEIDGPDVKDCITALGRTHTGSASTTMEILEEKNQVNRLQGVLNGLYNSPEVPTWPLDGKDNIKWLADVLSFSKPRPGDDQTVLGDNAARFGTIHGRPYDYTVGITCTGCDRMFAHKVGSFVLPTELRNAKAYRIPGLKYLCSEKDGLAILIQGDKIVGRMIWATPACSCRKTEVVTLRMPESFLPSAFSIN